MTGLLSVSVFAMCLSVFQATQSFNTQSELVSKFLSCLSLHAFCNLSSSPRTRNLLRTKSLIVKPDKKLPF